MRWERLFQDLEDQLERETDAELEDLARDEERLRIARLTLADRLHALLSGPSSLHEVTVALSLTTLVCRIVRVGRDWALVQITSPGTRRGTALLPTGAMRSLTCNAVGPRLRDREHSVLSRTDSGRTSSPAVADAGVSSGIGIAFVLRDLCRRRRQVTLVSHDREWTGTIERVGKDHLDLAVHPLDQPRTSDAVTTVSVIALAHIELIVLV